MQWNWCDDVIRFVFVIIGLITCVIGLLLLVGGEGGLRTYFSPLLFLPSPPLPHPAVLFVIYRSMVCISSYVPVVAIVGFEVVLVVLVDGVRWFSLILPCVFASPIPLVWHLLRLLVSFLILFIYPLDYSLECSSA